MIISGAQGVGKTTLINLLLKARPSLQLSISSTTRLKRPGEKDGEYNFLTDEKFTDKESNGDFLEVVQVHGYRYGTEKIYFADNIILNVTASSIKNFMSLIHQNQHYVSIFIDAPLHLIRERIKERKDQDIDKKMAFSIEEIKHKHHFHHIINNQGPVNDSLKTLLKIVDEYTININKNKK